MYQFRVTIRQDKQSIYVEHRAVKFRPIFPDQDWLYEPMQYRGIVERMRQSDLFYRQIEQISKAKIPRVSAGSRYRQGLLARCAVYAGLPGWCFVSVMTDIEAWYHV